MRPALRGEMEQVLQWQEKVKHASGVAEELCQGMEDEVRSHALAQLQPAMQASVDIAQARAKAAIARLSRGHPDVERLVQEAEAEKQHSAALMTAVEQAQLRIVSAAYVTVR